MGSQRNKHYAGIDGGATKTAALCGDGKGNVRGCGLAGPSNYQVVGAKAAMEAVAEALDGALQRAGLSRDELDFTVFALSGADLPADFDLLQEQLACRFPGLDFQLVNDCWAAFRAGTDASYGAVSICGTGTNAAARNRKGEQTALRSLGYESGNWGGAADLAREALHHAFRSEEGTGPQSSLEKEVLAAFNGEFGDYSHLSAALRDDLSLRFRSMYLLPVLVFKAAFEGDGVSQEILCRMGKAAGGDCAAVIRKVGLDREPCDVVPAGGMYAASRQHSPLLMDSFVLALHRAAPLARLRLPRYEPAAGAYLLAAEAGGARIRHGDGSAAAVRLACSYKELEPLLQGQESK